MKTIKLATCHPERKAHAKGLCRNCYSKVSYGNNRLKRIEQAKAYQRKHYVPSPRAAKQRVVTRELRTYFNDDGIPPIKEGFPHGKFYFTAAESASLEACLKRRGLNRPQWTMGGWRKAA